MMSPSAAVSSPSAAVSSLSAQQGLSMAVFHKVFLKSSPEQTYQEVVVDTKAQILGAPHQGSNFSYVFLLAAPNQ